MHRIKMKKKKQMWQQYQRKNRSQDGDADADGQTKVFPAQLLLRFSNIFVLFYISFFSSYFCSFLFFYNLLRCIFNNTVAAAFFLQTAKFIFTTHTFCEQCLRVAYVENGGGPIHTHTHTLKQNEENSIVCSGGYKKTNHFTLPGSIFCLHFVFFAFFSPLPARCGGVYVIYNTCT